MRRWFAVIKIALWIFVPVTLVTSLLPLQPASGLSVSSDSALIYFDTTEAFNGAGSVRLPVLPQKIDKQMYIPAVALRQLFGWRVEVLKNNERFLVASPDRVIIFDIKRGYYLLDGLESPVGWHARFKDGTLFLRVKGLATLYDLNVNLDTALKQVYLTYVPPVVEDVQMPVARFYTPKSEYRIGERVRYFDVSYSPTDEHLADAEWTGKRDVFFEPGEKVVKLRVTDKAGRASRWFTKVIRVVPEVYHNALQYHVFSEDVGRSMAFPSEELRQQVVRLPKMEGLTGSSYERKLLVSNSPETVKEFGVLYSDKLAGNVRLYASHVNGTNERMIFALMVTNPAPYEVNVTMSRRGEIVPTRFAQLNGRQGALEYLMDQQPPKPFLVPARGTTLLAKLPTLQTQQGVHVIYDFDPQESVALRYSVIAVPETTNLRELMAENLASLDQLPFHNHVRGTFATAEKVLQIEGERLVGPRVLQVADGKRDEAIRGYDVTRGVEVLNQGSYGVVYKVRVQAPPAMTLMMRASGGSYKGHFKINDEIVLVPGSGTLQPQDGLFVLARTTGEEEMLDIEFSPPAGSSLPIDLLFMPHADGAGLY